MKNKIIGLVFVLLTFTITESRSQCAVTIIPQGPTTFCEGDSVILNASAIGGSQVPDQSQLIYNAGTSARNLPGYSHWQSFTAGITGTLSEIDLGFFTYINGIGTLNIFSGTGTGGTLLQSQTVNVFCSGGNCTLPFNVSAPVVSGQVYTFQFIPGPGLPDPYGVQVENPGTYPGGEMAIVDPSGTYLTGFDMVFQTFVGGRLYYQWSDGSDDSTLVADTSGMYIVTVTDSAGCTSIDSIQVTVNPDPVVNLGNDTIICNGCSITLDAGGGFATYSWSTGATTQTITVNSTGVYTVMVTNASGCTGTDEIEVDVSSVGIAELNSGANFSFDISYSDNHLLILLKNAGNGKITAELSDVNGRMLKRIVSTGTTGKIDFDLNSFSKGVYFLQIANEQKRLIKKILK